MTASKKWESGNVCKKDTIEEKRVMLRVISSKSMTPKDMLPRNRRIFATFLKYYG